jgi:F-type H+-transporting ATPase subunit alpha
VEILKQPQYKPLPVEKQVLILFAGGNGYLDELPLEDLGRYEDELYRFIETRRPTVLQTIADKKQISEELSVELHGALKEFAKEFKAAAAAAV